LVPDFTEGPDDVIALTIDMNRLFEDYLMAQLRKAGREISPGVKVHRRNPDFWYQTNGARTKRLFTDIVMEWPGHTVVLDAKWKMPGSDSKLPDDAELKQMFAYLHSLGNASAAYLLYPAGHLSPRNDIEGVFAGTHLTCGYRFLPILQGNRLSVEWAEDLMRELAPEQPFHELLRRGSLSEKHRQ
jgi:5-methylcytosine-specific restriction enzyme subunit McrC